MFSTACRARIRPVSDGCGMKGLLVIVSAPSGAGKTTLIKRLLEAEPDCAFAVSHTTRKPRDGEVEGRDYYFVSEEKFHGMAEVGDFAEWAEVYQGLYYGTGRSEVERLRDSGRDVVFEVDFHGGRSLMRLYPDAISIFVLPPSMAVVKERLTGRGTDDERSIAERLATARTEIATAHEYRYIVTNDDLETAVEDIRTIVRAARLDNERSAEQVRALVAEDV